eukprot:c20758_g1_i1 orf=427-645(+)
MAATAISALTMSAPAAVPRQLVSGAKPALVGLPMHGTSRKGGQRGAGTCATERRLPVRCEAIPFFTKQKAGT